MPLPQGMRKEPCRTDAGTGSLGNARRRRARSIRIGPNLRRGAPRAPSPLVLASGGGSASGAPDGRERPDSTEQPDSTGRRDSTGQSDSTGRPDSTGRAGEPPAPGAMRDGPARHVPQHRPAARRAQLNYDSAGPCLEGWAALAALAQATRRLRLGSLVTGIHYRHPAVLANMAATIDISSGGRLELGIGAGSHSGRPRAARRRARVPRLIG